MRAQKLTTLLAFFLGQLSIIVTLRQCVYKTIWSPLGDAPAPNTHQLRRVGYPPRQYDREAPPMPTTRAHCIDKNKLPYKCGVVFVYHVPSTGGATISNWFRSYKGTASFFQRWSRRKDGGGTENTAREFAVGKDGRGGMAGLVRGIGGGEWRIAHCHHSNMNLNASELLLSQWRSAVESQGCAFVATAMLREPLSHTLSLYKHVERFNSTRERWLDHLRTRSEMGPWQTQLDYFLYNLLARNPDGVDKGTKVRRALELLRTHFDIVTVGDHDKYKAELLEMTGWDEKKMVRSNTSRRKLSFTKKEVEEVQRLIEENGDVDFVREVKSTYRKYAKDGSDCEWLKSQQKWA